MNFLILGHCVFVDAKKLFVNAKESMKNLGTRRQVFNGTAVKTTGGLTKGDLIQTPAGKITTRAARARGRKVYKSNGLSKWVKACKAAGYMQSGANFKPLPKKGTAGYRKIRAIYDQM